VAYNEQRQWNRCLGVKKLGVGALLDRWSGLGEGERVSLVAWLRKLFNKLGSGPIWLEQRRRNGVRGALLRG
jgi:hypothetical protein